MTLLLLLLVFVMFSFENVCEYHVKCYPKGYAHSVQTKDGPVCTLMLGL